MFLNVEVMECLRCCPKIFYRIYGPKSLSILIHLRSRLSKLNLHKFKHNFRESLKLLRAINDGVEDTDTNLPKHDRC